MRLNLNEIWEILEPLRLESIDIYQGGFPDKLPRGKAKESKILEIRSYEKGEHLNITFDEFKERIKPMIDRGGIFYLVLRPTAKGGQGRNMFYELELPMLQSAEIVKEPNNNFSTQNDINELIRAAEERIRNEFIRAEEERKMNERILLIEKKEKELDTLSGKLFIFLSKLISNFEANNLKNPLMQGIKDEKIIQNPEDIKSVNDAVSVLVHFGGEEFLINLSKKVMKDPSLVAMAKNFLQL